MPKKILVQPVVSTIAVAEFFLHQNCGLAPHIDQCVQPDGAKLLWNVWYYSPRSKDVVALPGLKESRADAIAWAKQLIEEERRAIAIAARINSLIDELLEEGFSIPDFLDGLAECCDQRDELGALVSEIETLV